MVSHEKRIARIRAMLHNAMIADRWAIQKALRSVTGKGARGKPSSFLQKRLDALEDRVKASSLRRQARLDNRPQVTYPQHLPIFEKHGDIIEAVKENQVIIVSGETGSGKSTQLPKMCLEAGLGLGGRIGCTQPRRIAATTIARRIAEEMGEKLGRSVGYKIRFSDKTGPEAYIKIMTDGMLLAEAQQDRFLNEYEALIIDEAHERSLNIDFLLGILRTLLPRRKDLKVIITSATLETEKFSEAFNNSPIVEVKGRLFPVEVTYMPPEEKDDEPEDASYIDRAVEAIEQIISRKGRGDVLVFMPTEQDIRETCDRLGARGFPNTSILPLFARLPGERQSLVFNPMPGRKIVVATNVAETSLTIPGIRYVVDTGLARIPRYLPGTRTTSLAVSAISKSSADQRKGRSGRLENGVCIRLYSEADYEKREEHTPPEIQRSNLAEVILRMLSLKLGDIRDFPFVDRPSARSIKDGFDLLTELGAIQRERERVSMTRMGWLMARLPLDPRMARMMIEARKEKCEKQIAVIASALGIQDPRQRPPEHTAEADEKHRAFQDENSDFLTLYNIWNAFQRAFKEKSTQAGMRKFCKARSLSFVRMREWRDIHEQITTLLGEQDLEPVGSLPQKEFKDDSLYARIHRSILSGFLSNIATRKEKNIYRATRGREVMVFPGSALFNTPPQWIVAAEMVKTSRLFARTVARIDPDWLEALGGELCRSNYHSPHWSKTSGDVRATEQVTLFGLLIVPGRTVPYGRIDPGEAHRIFVHSALVQGEIKGDFPFLKHNRDLIKRFASIEDRIRRRDILVSEQAMADFYSERLEGVHDVRTLRRRIREMGGDSFLFMREADLIQSLPGKGLLKSYPDHLRMGPQSFPLTYRFDPGSLKDGVTVSVPSTLATGLNPASLEWMVPGVFEEKLTALIKGLPKKYRKQLVPVSDTVQLILGEMEKTEEPLVSTLSRFIYRRLGVDIPAAAWPTNTLPDHLRMRVAITDHKGRELHASRDPGVLLESPGATVSDTSRALEKARGEWERDGITAWDFDTLPEKILVESSLAAYPALEPSEQGVRIRLFGDPVEAENVHRKGVARLLSIRLATDLKFAKKVLRLPDSMEKAALYFKGPRALERALLDALARHLLRGDQRSREEFEAFCGDVSPRIIPEANDLLDKTLRILEAYKGLRLMIQAVETSRKTPSAVTALCGALRHALENLVPGNFLELYPPEHLAHIPRYIKAMEIRLERGSYDLQKDEKKAQEVRVFEGEIAEIKKELSPNATHEKRLAVDELGWLIQEFRVSTFAPELSTAVKVSPKRLKKKIEEIRRMV